MLTTYNVQFDVHGWVEYEVVADSMEEAILEAKERIKTGGYFQKDLEVVDYFDKVTGVVETKVPDCPLSPREE